MLGAGGEGGADLTCDHAEECHGGGLLVGVVQRLSGAGGVAGMPSCPQERSDGAGSVGPRSRAPCVAQHLARRLVVVHAGDRVDQKPCD